MTLEEFVKETIKIVGGRWRKDRDGAYWEVKEGGFVLQAEPFATRHSEGVTCGFDCALSHVEFARIGNAIMGVKPGDFLQMKGFQKLAEVPNEVALPQQVEAQMRELVHELKHASLPYYIEKFSVTLPQPSMPQVCHLTALAWKGNLDKLIEYEESFAQGHRLGFVPMITADMIDRALDIAARNAA